MIRLLVGAALTALLIACGGPTPLPPTPTPTPAGSPTAQGSPGPTPSGGSFSPIDPGAVAELPPQPALAGLYLPAGVLAQGTDHYALIQARMDCQTLTGVLGAGQWTLADRATLAIPTQDPAQPTPAIPLPEFTLPEWLLLRWGHEYAVARVGGDENGCLAQVWRLTNGPYAAHGAIESVGEANALQTMCAAGNGLAELSALYIGADGTFFSLQTTVPLQVGSHPIDRDTELNAGRQGPTVELAFDMLYGGLPADEQEMPGIVDYFPADVETLVWQGSIDVTSVDPLVGEISFEGLRNEAGDPLTLSTAFRCDLRPGQLTRAAEQAANATPSPAPSPSPAPGRVSVQIASGPHMGTHEAMAPDATCSLGLFTEGRWMASYSATDPVQGELQSLSLDLPADGGKATMFMFFGDDFDRDWFNTDEAQAEVTDNGTSVEFVVNGHAAGTDFTIDFVCYDIARF